MKKQCPLCQCAEFSPVIRCPDHLGSGEWFQVVRCNRCSFLFTSDAPEAEEIGRYYDSSAYEPLKGKRSVIKSFVRKLRQKHVARVIEKTIGRSSGSILDIGAGMCDFLRLMAARGWNVTGIEPDAACRSNALAEGMRVLKPEVIHTLPSASMDVITLWHVLEHIHDLAGTGHEIRRLLKPDGCCMIAVPNANAYDARLYGKDWHGYELPRHLYHFTRRTLKQFADNAGMKVLSIRPMYLDSVYCCLKSEEYLGGNSLSGLLRSGITLAASVLRPSVSTTMLAVLRHKEQIHSRPS